MNENCYEAVYSEDYADYIVEYNGDRQVLEEIYSNACLFFIDNRYAILYSKKRSDYMESFGNLAYNIFPKLLAPMDAAVGEAAYNTPSILSMINGENLDNRLSRIESTMFGTTFANDTQDDRLRRITSAYKATRSASKYDSNKFSQNMATAMQIGTLLLMILACVL